MPPEQMKFRGVNDEEARGGRTAKHDRARRPFPAQEGISVMAKETIVIHPKPDGEPESVRIAADAAKGGKGK